MPEGTPPAVADSVTSENGDIREPTPEPTEEEVKRWIESAQWQNVEDAVLRGKATAVKRSAVHYQEIARFLNVALLNEDKLTKAISACRTADLASLKNNLENRKIALGRGKNGATLLHIAARHNHTQIVDYLATRYPDLVHTVDNHTREPLHYAAKFGQSSSTYRALLAKGADPAKVDRFGYTPQDYALKNRPRMDSQMSEMFFPYDDELSEKDSATLDRWLANGDVEALEKWVLDGKGHLLQDKETMNPEAREFLDVLPHYMAKIESIHSAVEDGDVRRTRTLIDQPKLALSRDRKGSTPLHNAVLYGQMDTVRYLLQKFPESVNAVDNGGRTALHYAAADKAGSHMIKLLQKAGADAFVEDAQGHTPFYYRSHPHELNLSNLRDEAVIDQLTAGEVPRSLLQDLEEDISTWLQSGDVARLEDLVLHGYGDLIAGRMADVDDYDVLSFLEVLPQYQAKIRAIHLAVQNGNLKEVKTLTDRKKLALSRDSKGATPLHNAVLFNKEDVVKYFVRNYPQAVNAKDHARRTPLHYAASTNDGGRLYKVLRKAGADPDIADCYGHTAKHYLSHPEDLDLRALVAKTDANIRESLSHRIAPNYMEASIQTWLKEGNVTKLEQLVLSGCGDLLEDRDCSNPESTEFLESLPSYLAKIHDIHAAVRAGQTKKVKDLIDRKRLALARDRKGCTPLHNAILYGQTEIVRHLAQTYPNVINAPDYKKRAPVHYAGAARDGGHHYKILDRAGADTTLTDSEGHRADFYLRNPGALNLQHMRDRDKDFFLETGAVAENTEDAENRPHSSSSTLSAASSSTNYTGRSGAFSEGFMHNFMGPAPGANRRTNLSRINETGSDAGTSAVPQSTTGEGQSMANGAGISFGPNYKFQPTTPVGQYLANTLGPILTKALAEIVVQRPGDPVEYLSKYLYRFNEEAEAQQGEKPKEAVAQACEDRQGMHCIPGHWECGNEVQWGSHIDTTFKKPFCKSHCCSCIEAGSRRQRNCRVTDMTGLDNEIPVNPNFNCVWCPPNGGQAAVGAAYFCNYQEHMRSRTTGQFLPPPFNGCKSPPRPN